jgi:quercetin dioxygenase-like cupin family protein
MSDSLDLSIRRSTNAADAQEVFSPQEHSPPMNEYLTDVSNNGGDYCVIRCVLPAGAVVPMHSHADRETFYVVSGKIEGLRVDRWEELGPGDIVDVRDGARHAWRNSSQTAATMICVTTTKMARFLQEVSAAGASPEEQAARFLRLVRANGCWLASPEENAAIGLDANWAAFAIDCSARSGFVCEATVAW